MSYEEEYASAVARAQWLADLKKLFTTVTERNFLRSYGFANADFVEQFHRQQLTPEQAAAQIKEE